MSLNGCSFYGGGEENLVEVLGGEVIIRTYTMKNSIFHKKESKKRNSVLKH